MLDLASESSIIIHFALIGAWYSRNVLKIGLIAIICSWGRILNLWWLFDSIFVIAKILILFNTIWITD